MKNEKIALAYRENFTVYNSFRKISKLTIFNSTILQSNWTQFE